MALTAYDAARDYIEEASARGVLAIAPRTLSSRLGCTEEQSLALLKELKQNGLGEFRGYIYCGSCREAIALNSSSLSDLFREGSSLVGTECRYCGEIVSWEVSNIEVQLSFFFSAVTTTVVTAQPTGQTAESAARSPIALPTIAAADKLNIQNIIIVQPGGRFSMGDNTLAQEEPTAGNSSAKANIGIKAGLEAMGESSVDSQAKFRGKETHRIYKRSSWLASMLFGHSEEEREREGKYDEQVGKRNSRSWRVGIFITIAIVLVAGAVLLIRWLAKQ